VKLPDDPFVRELLPEFIESWLQDIDNYNEYEEKQQVDELYRMAHTLKGSCYQFGFSDLGDMGIKLMEYAKIPDWDKSRQLYNIIKSRFIELNDYLNKHNIT
jgi:chemotaxis protein histidine kinase CheA